MPGSMGVLAAFWALIFSATMRAQSEIEAVDHGDVGSVEDAFEIVGEGNVLRHEDVGRDAGGGGVGCEGSGGVACAGDGKVLEAIVFGHGDGEAEAAGFECAGGVGSLLFDIEAGVALAVNEGSPTFAEGHRGARPEGRYCSATCRDLRGTRRRRAAISSRFAVFLSLLHVIADIEGTGTERANGLGGVGRKVMVTAGTFERND